MCRSKDVSQTLHIAMGRVASHRSSCAVLAGQCAVSRGSEGCGCGSRLLQPATARGQCSFSPRPCSSRGRRAATGHAAWYQGALRLALPAAQSSVGNSHDSYPNRILVLKLEKKNSKCMSRLCPAKIQLLGRNTAEFPIPRVRHAGGSSFCISLPVFSVSE